MGINGGRGINSGLVLGSSGINIAGGGEAPFTFGNALEFDGVDDFVSFPNLTELNSTSKATYSFWLKIINTSKRVEIGSAPSGTNGLYILYIHPDLYTQTRNGGTGSNTFNYSSFVTGWHHIAFIYDGTQAVNNDRVKLFVDGVEQTYNYIAAVPTSLSSTVGNNFKLNNLFNQYGQFDIDEFAVWNTALTSTDVNNLYNAGNGDFATNYQAADLIAYWRMNESGTDTTAIDSSGNGNDGTLNNFPASGMWVAH